MLGGSVIIEQIFTFPGMGQYFFIALFNKDLPVIQGVVLLARSSSSCSTSWSTSSTRPEPEGEAGVRCR